MTSEVKLEPTAEEIERVADAINEADVGYRMTLTRLVDGVYTYELVYDGEAAIEFDNTDDLYEHVGVRKREAMATAAILAMDRRASPPAVQETWRNDEQPIGYVDRLSEPGRISPIETLELDVPVYASPPAPAVAVPEGWKPVDLSFQAGVQQWMLSCFGREISADKVERNHRFLEEALELVQALGCTASEAHQLVDYTFGREIGDPAQEAGGVMVTLAALCLANGLDMATAGDTELARVWTKIEKIRAKQAAKPKHSPLPAAPQPPATRGDEPFAYTTQGWIDTMQRNLGSGSFWGTPTGVPTEIALYRAPPATRNDEPTKEMIQAGLDDLGWEELGDPKLDATLEAAVASVYRAMRAAAPLETNLQKMQIAPADQEPAP